MRIWEQKNDLTKLQATAPDIHNLPKLENQFVIKNL